MKEVTSAEWFKGQTSGKEARELLEGLPPGNFRV